MHLIFKGVALALVLVGGFLLTTRVIPWLAIRALRLLGFRAEASPVTLKRIERLKRIKRGYWSFLAITSLFVTSLFLELIVNGRALVIHYEDRTAFPAVAEWASKALFFADVSYFQKKSDFGQTGDSEVDYHRFARDCAHPEVLRAEIDRGRKEIADERARIATPPTGRRTPGDRIRAAQKETSLKLLEEELDQVEKTYSVFASGRAWCVMPVYEFGPSEFRHDLAANPPNAPSLSQGVPLGTDESGRDVLVLLLYGFRISLTFALIVWAVGYATGTIVGAIQGYYGGWTDILFQRFEEIWAAIPFLFTIMIIASLRTPTFLVLAVLMIVLRSWLGITFYMRAEYYREKAKDYVQAAIGCGVSDAKIMTRHILPNAIVPIVTFAPFAIVAYIDSLVSLDYLGFGLPPGTPSWGNLLKQGLDNVKFYPHLVTAPTVALILTLLGSVLIGEAVREAFDPKVFSRIGCTKARGAGAPPDPRGGRADDGRLLDVRGLKTFFDVEGKTAKAVDGVDLDVRENEVFGVVGESGSGKTVTALSILRLVPSPPGWIDEGQITFRGRDLTKLSFPEVRKIRGKEISMIFQEPMTALNPVFTIGFQMREVLKQHEPGLSRAQLDDRATQLLEQVGLPDPRRRLASYPNQFSGGQRQRIMIAMALALKPHLLVADEPTTALDVTIQAQILELMLGLQKQTGQTSILLITHNLAVVAETCQRVAVMYGGKVQELSATRELFASPLHPYTRGLLRSLPRPDRPKQRRLEAIPGIVPSVLDFPRGCKFWTRCPEKIERCEQEEPELREIAPAHFCRCHLAQPAAAPATGGTS